MGLSDVKIQELVCVTQHNKGFQLNSSARHSTAQPQFPHLNMRMISTPSTAAPPSSSSLARSSQAGRGEGQLSEDPELPLWSLSAILTSALRDVPRGGSGPSEGCRTSSQVSFMGGSSIVQVLETLPMPNSWEHFRGKHKGRLLGGPPAQSHGGTQM